MNKTATSDRHEQARRAYEQGELRQAMRIVRSCLDEDPNDGRAWELCGLVHYSSGNFRESVRAIERASLIVPLRPAGRVCLGHAYGRVGRIDLARDLLNALVDDDSLPVPLLLTVASGLDELGRADLAMIACRRAIARDDEMAQAHYDLGFYASRCGFPDEMVESLARKAIDLAPDVPKFRVGLAGLLQNQGRDGDAYPLISRLTNDDLVALNCRCCLERIIEVYQQAQDHRRAIVCQQRLLQLEAHDDGPTDGCC